MSNSNFEITDGTQDDTHSHAKNGARYEFRGRLFTSWKTTEGGHVYIPANGTKPEFYEPLFGDDVYALAPDTENTFIIDRARRYDSGDFTFVAPADSSYVRGTKYLIGGDWYRIDDRFEFRGKTYHMPPATKYLVLSWVGGTSPDLVVDTLTGNVYGAEHTPDGVIPCVDQIVTNIKSVPSKAYREPTMDKEPDFPVEDLRTYDAMDQSMIDEVFGWENKAKTPAKNHVELLEEQLKAAREDAAIEDALQIMARRRTDYSEHKQEVTIEMLKDVVVKPIHTFTQLDYFNEETGACGYSGAKFEVFGPMLRNDFNRSNCLRLMIPDDYTKADALNALVQFKKMIDSMDDKCSINAQTWEQENKPVQF